MVSFLLVAALGAAQPVTTINFDAQALPLGEALAQLAVAGGLSLVVGPDVAADRPVTAHLERIAPDRALRLIAGAYGLAVTEVDGTWLVRAAEPAGAPPSPVRSPAVTVAPPPAAPPRALQPPRPSGQPVSGTAAAGAVVAGAPGYQVIKLKYAYAPGIAQLLGGRGILYSEIDPWYRGLGGAGGGFGGSGLGGGVGVPSRGGLTSGIGNGGLGQMGGGLQGYGQPGFGQGDGRQQGGLAPQGRSPGVLPLPNGVDNVVGLDWLNSLLVTPSSR